MSAGDSVSERLGSVGVVAEYEVRRSLSKKALLLGVALALLPLAVAFIVKYYTRPEHLGSTRLLWASMAGLDPIAAMNALLNPAASLNAVSFWWLIVVLFAGDLLASDARDGAMRLLLSKPLTRGEYLAGKLLGVLAMLTLVALLGMGGVVGASYILAGSQEHVILAPVIGVLLVVGGLPLLLVTALVGLRSRSPLSGFIFGIIIYFVFQMITSFLGIYLAITGHATGIIDGGYRASILLPFSGGKSLATLYYLLHAYGKTLTTPMTGAGIEIGGHMVSLGGTLHVDQLYFETLASILVWSLALLAISYLIIRRMDL